MLYAHAIKDVMEECQLLYSV